MPRRPPVLPIAAVGGTEERDSSRNAHRGHPGIQRGHEPSTGRLRRSPCDARSRHPRRERRVDRTAPKTCCPVSAFRGSPCRSGWESGEQCAPAYGTRRDAATPTSSASMVMRSTGRATSRDCWSPVLSGTADAAIGSRFLARGSGAGIRRMSQSALAVLLTILTRRRVTDPTSGFWLFGPRALALLARHHPGGYAEPELVLFLSRNSAACCRSPDPNAAETLRADVTHRATRRNRIRTHGACAAGRSLSADRWRSSRVTDRRSSSSRSASAQRSWWRSSNWYGGGR